MKVDLNDPDAVYAAYDHFQSMVASYKSMLDISKSPGPMYDKLLGKYTYYTTNLDSLMSAMMRKGYTIK